MLRQARRIASRAGRNATLVEADLRRLPFRAGAFDTATLTFPTPVIRDPRLWTELARVVRSGGRVVVVLSARRLGTPLDCGDILERLTASGFRGERHDVAAEGRLVTIIVATAQRAGADYPKSELTDSSM